MKSKEVKILTIDIAKVISYLNNLNNKDEQNYVTSEGLSLLEGVALTTRSKVKVVSLTQYKELENKYNKLKNKKKSWF